MRKNKVLLKIVAWPLSNNCETEGSLPDEQFVFGPARSTIDMLFVVRRFQEPRRQTKFLLHVCFIDLQNVYDSVGQELLSKVLIGSGVLITLLRSIRNSHESMRVRMCMCVTGCMGHVLRP